jgi:hypothetical protein
MGAFAAGQVVVLPFPFSDLTRNKFRPALLLADVGRGDWIACQITSNAFAEELQPQVLRYVRHAVVRLMEGEVLS